MSELLINSVFDKYGVLEARIKELNASFSKYNPEAQYLAELPFPFKLIKGREDQISLLVDDVIAEGSERYQVTNHHRQNKAALGKALKVLTLIDYEPDQDRKSTIRMPGVIIVDNSIADLVSSVNEAKRDFKEAVGKVPGNLMRSVVKKEMTCCFLHAYRQIPMITAPVESIRLTWANSNSSIKKITVQELGNLIDSYYSAKSVGEQGVSSNGIEETDQRQENMKALVSHLAENEVLAIKRAVKPHVKANLRFKNNERKAIDGSVPILVTRSAAAEMKAIGSLENSGIAKRVRQSVYEDTPVIEKLNCYRYKEPEYA